MMNIIDLCKNVNFKVNLFDLIMVLVTSVLIIGSILVVKKIVLVSKKARKLDERLRETRARSLRVISEMEQYNNFVQVEVVKTETETVRGTTATQDLELLTNEFIGGTLPQTPTKDIAQLIENSTPDTSDTSEEESKEEVPCIKEIYEEPKRKKTRAMSMEERWAEYDKKRSMRSTA